MDALPGSLPQYVVLSNTAAKYPVLIYFRSISVDVLYWMLVQVDYKFIVHFHEAVFPYLYERKYLSRRYPRRIFRDCACHYLILDVVHIRKSSCASATTAWLLRILGELAPLKKKKSVIWCLGVYCRGRTPGCVCRLAACDDLKVLIHFLRQSYCTGFNCCKTLYLGVLYCKNVLHSLSLILLVQFIGASASSYQFLLTSEINILLKLCFLKKFLSLLLMNL